MSSRQQPWDWGEAVSDALPAAQQLVEMESGELHHYVPPGSLHDQLGVAHVPITSARSSGSAATHDQQNWGSRGAANVPGPHNKLGK
jgi:hypothetical protein